ncbi:MAG TPA: hypothetical protein VGM32_15740 [Rhodopila sp.]|jgi:hypothetical protein
MAYISLIAVERALRSLEQKAEGIGSHHATEAAHVLLATSPRHAMRFARAMHSRMAASLDTDLIEHWAGVVTEVARLQRQRKAA